MSMCYKPHDCNNHLRCKYTIPSIPPLNNIMMSVDTLKMVYEYKVRNWAIGQLYPNGGPDEFTYFFSIRGITIYNYVDSPTLKIGGPSAYDKNIANLSDYINYNIDFEVKLIDIQIAKIRCYQSRNWAIGESYPEPGPDSFVIFFAERELPIAPYLRGTVNIGDPSAYEVNIKTLKDYRKKVLLYCI